ncbi:carbohydrate ABC transporter permease [Clostridium felsineum]|uniref:Melibiose/raffinose/stachyose import permease protein MelD n=1 Tax=Clostridium felsineum TaxID=36839 RepID=A0A1S8MA97_9CLOT|nr:sugar ABC transporter permease [Clostridium felsineum]URZ08786.1 Melibiose/raffinose/stachyose import permease protein MelD [Clostridium felsineum]URZ09414.1 Melibiose/raffinose/stachyose import permease protein MelD [Clostridium felsineum]
MKLANKYWKYAFVLPMVVLYLIFFMYPLVQGIIVSFTSWDGLSSVKHFIGLKNYMNLFSDNDFVKSISFTLELTIVLIVIEIVVGLVIAVLLERKIKFNSFFRTAYFFPAVLSGMTVSLIFSQIFQYGIPEVGNGLNIAALKLNPLSNHTGAFIAIAFVMLWQGVALPILLFLAGLMSVPKDIIEAASVDGATSKQIFFKIKLPFLLPTLSIVFILALKAGLLAFDQIVALTYGSVDTQSIGLLLYNDAVSSFRFGYANSMGTLLFIVIIILSLIQIKVSSRYEVRQ